MLGIGWNKVIDFLKDWGTNPIISGLFLLIIGGVLTKILPGIYKGFVKFIAWLGAKLRGRGADHDFEKLYLDWLIREHRHLGLLPAQIIAMRWKDRQQLTNLEDVFIKLSMSSQSGDELWTETYGKGESTWRKRPWFGLRFLSYIFRRKSLSKFLKFVPFLAEQTYEPGDIGLVVDRHKRLVIRGDPGSGKSTILRYLTVTCARALRNQKNDGDSPGLVTKRLLWTIRPFPILVTLRRHGKVASWDEAKELTDTFLEEMPSELRRRCPKGFFERHLQKGNCLILLDAFDELGNPDARAAMARKISGFIEIYSRNNNRIVVTTRIIGYEGQLDKYGFSVRTVQNLRAGEIRALVKQRYRAIALSESAGKQDQESKDIKQNLLERAEHLIEKIEDAPRLSQLAANPMLLSLIVLVHSLKVELPEERLLLYRDCVEILTERWQQIKREEAGMKKEDRDGLGLSQKLILLRELAFAMQQQRKEEGSIALIPTATAQALIADRLPDFLEIELPQSEGARKEVLRRKAEAWIKGIQSESGILVEQGLDELGEPLIGFSHLTFQEYLAAVALNENDGYQPILWQNLLQPTWQEVLLLYVALSNDATPLISALLQSSTQPRGLLLAGQCLAERLKKVETHLQYTIITKLKEGFSKADEDAVSDYGKVLAALGKTEVTAFMRTQLQVPSLKKRVAAIKALGQTRANDPEIEETRQDLTQFVETPNEVEITVTAEEALAQIGDFRFTNLEPRTVRLKIASLDIVSLKGRKKPINSLDCVAAKKNNSRFDFLIRRLDFLLWTSWDSIRKKLPQKQEFEIGKYPVTNIEYDRFIMATGHKPPSKWKERTFPQEEATHPVAGITFSDARAYCKWLSSVTGNKYRLPTEWEWEFAAVGSRGWKYPWGEQFDNNKCNTKESGREGTTPVGSHLAGINPEGIFDLVGNVWEYTKSYSIKFVPTIILFSISIVPLVSFTVYFVLGIAELNIIQTFINLLNILLTILLMFISIMLVSLLNHQCRGGAWNEPFDKATCYYRGSSDNISSKLIGIRILKEIE